MKKLLLISTLLSFSCIQAVIEGPATDKSESAAERLLAAAQDKTSQLNRIQLYIFDNHAIRSFKEHGTVNGLPKYGVAIANVRSGMFIHVPARLRGSGVKPTDNELDKLAKLIGILPETLESGDNLQLADAILIGTNDRKAIELFLAREELHKK
ncbi:hypothetical protein A3F06_00690 [candidate division TM6 bacterium RIFCSPHIGHO2_12_FULL_36_22]|nr:MAG: hypothetical protein A3F06_00690 [candidate division TM6 bacterium RIFCSPHIGHO2_12_FULL_36_22]